MHVTQTLLDVINQSAHLECQYDIFDHSVVAFLLSCMIDTLVMIGFFQKLNMLMIFNQIM